jgi:hypothetical protein
MSHTGEASTALGRKEYLTDWNKYAIPCKTERTTPRLLERRSRRELQFLIQTSLKILTFRMSRGREEIIFPAEEKFDE